MKNILCLMVLLHIISTVSSGQIFNPDTIAYYNKTELAKIATKVIQANECEILYDMSLNTIYNDSLIILYKDNEIENLKTIIYNNNATVIYNDSLIISSLGTELKTTKKKLLNRNLQLYSSILIFAITIGTMLGLK